MSHSEQVELANLEELVGKYPEQAMQRLSIFGIAEVLIFWCKAMNTTLPELLELITILAPTAEEA